MTPSAATILAEMPTLLTPAHVATATGAGVRVAVLDTGLDRDLLTSRHPQALLRECVTVRFSQIHPAADSPSSLHGTTVADILLSLAPQVELYSADVFGPQGNADVDTLVTGLHHAMDVWNAKVINLSLGVIEARLQPPAKRNQLLRTIEEAYYRDVIVVAAAHNDHPLTRSFPAVASPPLLSVNKALFETADRVLYKLNEQIEFEAHSRGGLGAFSKEPATSWAAPHVAAVAARLVSLKPTLKPFELKTLLYWLSQTDMDETAGHLKITPRREVPESA